MKISFSSSTPTVAAIRQMTNAEAATAAIAAWNAGAYAAALAYVGASADEIWVSGPSVFIGGSHPPEWGGSPRPVSWTAKLGGSPRSCALADHILSVGGV